MYLRAAHTETSTTALLDFLKQHPLGLLTTAIPSTEHDYIQSSYIPWVLDTISADPDAPVKGRLRGHMARQNPQAKSLINAAKEQKANGEPAQLQQDVMVLFTHPDHHYVTPKFYVDTKPATGKVVPTWNYAAVQVYGRATIFHDSGSEHTSAYLQKQIQDLSLMCETDTMGYTGMNGRKEPWGVDDAPERYIELLRKNIIGVEVEITKIGGKFKMSQEMGLGDRQGVVKGFRALEMETGDAIAKMVEERGSR
ncbi:hypothetical protein LTR56_020082 [Elasticomyces elasticus]|nr:hypothetical protein LTR56_020082 [Elasticomyces elasticus]KAK3633845.1 hypothetical protein LTR22_019920 [Elasticomyces elasticus]KAK4910953.1 hypothetical protein LTR49_020398 [Elasticomyces elasticus]KAK5761042.1 hypothetical protein LTS12_008890 [Elasticomyces elasticus]